MFCLFRFRKAMSKYKAMEESLESIEKGTDEYLRKDEYLNGFLDCLETVYRK